MEPLAVLAVVSLGWVGLWAVVRRYAQDPRAEPWRTVARECKLTPAPQRRWGETLAWLDPSLRLRVQCRRYLREQEGVPDVHGVIFTIESQEGRLSPVCLRRETEVDGAAKAGGASEVETGDDAFDTDFYVTGSPSAARAALDTDTRRVLRTLLRDTDMVIEAHRLRGDFPIGAASFGPEGMRLARTLNACLEVLARLRARDDVAGRLAHIARTDPLSGVREHCLVALAREYPDNDATREALAAAAQDPSDAVKVRAAMLLGESGHTTLLHVAEGEDADELAAAQAVEALGARLAPERAEAILRRALRTRKTELARVCLRSIGRGGGEERIGLLVKVLAVGVPRLAVAAADALADTGLRAAEEPLLAALAHADPEVRLAAARALGEVGTARAVLPLKETEEQFSGDGTLRRTARQALAQIQSRFEGASPGQLSVVSAEVGTLSLVEDESGRLSLPDAGPRPGKDQ